MEVDTTTKLLDKADSIEKLVRDVAPIVWEAVIAGTYITGSFLVLVAVFY